VAAFDAHRIGSYGEPIYKPTGSGKSRKITGYTPHTRRCMTLVEIQASGMAQNDKGWWTLPKRDASVPHEDELEEATP
jgi:hypothetical protein